MSKLSTQDIPEFHHIIFYYFHHSCAEIRSDKLKSGELVAFGLGDQMHVFPRCELEQIAEKSAPASLSWYQKRKGKRDKKKSI